MNVRRRVIFGKVFIMQDKEIKDPKLFIIKGLIKNPSW